MKSMPARLTTRCGCARTLQVEINEGKVAPEFLEVRLSDPISGVKSPTGEKPIRRFKYIGTVIEGESNNVKLMSEYLVYQEE